MQSNTFIIQNEVGLHARPAALFVQTAAKFKAKIKVRNATRGTPFIDAKSILSVLGLAVAKGHEIEVTAEGEDEETALETIARLIEGDFTELTTT
ncbi:MAG: HPr family phosphocarrier protein [Anaerolineae bacterium]|nr:HPr family phosphocarrier protein [Anaerolineae bacterium]